MRRVTGWMVALMALATAPAWAQDDLKQQLEALRKEVEALKAEKVQESKPLEAPAAAKGESAELMAGNQAAPNPLITLFKETKISGFVDVGYNWNPNRPDDPTNTQVNAFRAFDTRANSFILHNAQINLARAATKEMWAGFKIELGVGSDADGFDAGYTGDIDSVLLQEAHIELLIPQVEGLTVRAGRLATLAGYEVFESKDNNQYSRALLFNWAIPFIHNGVRAEYSTLDGKVVVNLGVVNGWDNQLDNNTGKTLEFQLKVAPIKELEASLTLYHGAERDDEIGDKRTLLDIVVKYTLEKFSVGVNFDWGFEEFDSAPLANGEDDAAWNGYAFYARYQHDSVLAVSGRFERMRDEEGTRFGVHAAIWEATLTLEVKPTDYLIFRIEYRRDESTEEVFFRGSSTTDKQHTVGFEAIVLF